MTIWLVCLILSLEITHWRWKWISKWWVSECDHSRILGKFDSECRWFFWKYYRLCLVARSCLNTSAQPPKWSKPPGAAPSPVTPLQVERGLRALGLGAASAGSERLLLIAASSNACLDSRDHLSINFTCLRIRNNEICKKSHTSFCVSFFFLGFFNIRMFKLSKI